MKDINEQASIICRKSIFIKAEPEQVWKILTDIDNWPQWQTDIDKAVLNGPLEPKTSFDWKTGGAKIHSTLHTVKPIKHLGWTGKSFGMHAVHNWTLTEKEGKTIVEVEESMEGWLARVFKRLMYKNLEKGMLVWLRLLKKESEKK